MTVQIPEPNRIRQLLAGGQPQAALALAEKLVAANPRDAAALTLKGAGQAAMGRGKQALRSLNQALAIDPEHAEAHFGMGHLLQARGQPAKAIAHFRKALVGRPRDAGIRVMLANAQVQAGDARAALATLDAAEASLRGHFGIAATRADVLIRLGRLEEAAQSYRELLRSQPDNPALLNNLATALQGQNRNAEAREQLQRAVALSPQNVGMINRLAEACQQAGALDEAVRWFERSLELKPDQPPVVAHLAEARLDQGQPDAAGLLFERAIGLDSSLVSAWWGLAVLHERRGDLDDALSVIRKGRETVGDAPELRVLEARCARRKGELDVALDCLQGIGDRALPPVLDRLRYHERGQVLHRRDDPAGAWAEFVRSGELATEAARREGLDPNRHLVLADGWRALPAVEAPQAEGAASPSFIVGFPRSGTTLLDQFLDGHERIVTLEEAPFIGRLVREDPLHTGIVLPQGLPELSDADLSRLRAWYWQQVDRVTQRDADSVVIDRMPINFIHLPLMTRLFPSARVIFMLRHPLDVCLSCFMQFFRLNALTANFSDMQRTVRLYRSTMSLWLDYRERYADRIITVRYEDLVEDPGAVIPPVTEALGLTPAEGMLDHLSTLEAGKWVGTASYDQVSRPVYTSAVGRWQSYRQQLSPWIDALRPLIRTLGYPDPERG